jgi:hypothetical protein
MRWNSAYPFTVFPVHARCCWSPKTQERRVVGRLMPIYRPALT